MNIDPMEKSRLSMMPMEERIRYCRNKWTKEHVPLILLLLAIPLIPFLTGLFTGNGLLIFLGVLLCPVVYAYRYNKMMAYVEETAYEGKKMEKKRIGQFW